MSFILSIETSTSTCSVAIHNSGKLIAHQVHQAEKSHSSLLPSIVEELLKDANLSLETLEGIAVSGGPGSYTGLRIGVTTAKGICYALSIPLISVGTLDVMIEAVINKFGGDHYLCPMLDARRMEVYTKVVNQDLKEIWSLQPKVLEERSFSEFTKPTYLFGNGMPKFREISKQENLILIDDIFPDAANMGRISFKKYQSSSFEEIAYFEPNYLKEWRTTVQKKQLL